MAGYGGESWLNQAADNRNRGQLLSLYVMPYARRPCRGQFCSSLSDPAGCADHLDSDQLGVRIFTQRVPMPAFASARPVFCLAPTGL
jgi:hypothetical protein